MKPIFSLLNPNESQILSRLFSKLYGTGTQNSENHFFFKLFWGLLCKILVSQPEIESLPPAVEAWAAREVPKVTF